ncbi:MAG: HAD hydrolase-like protein [Acidimicrobiales bacterium]
MRPNLVRIAQDRARANYGTQFDAANTTLIGDTPNDVRAALDGGVRVIGVATGQDSVDDLRAAGAKTVLPDLTDLPALHAAIEAPG